MNNSKLGARSAGAGLFAAIVASLCCITPVLSLIAGIGGIASTFSWMEPLRPYLITLTIGVLGFAWYQKLKPRNAEEIECDCEGNEKPTFWQSKKFLGMITVIAIVMLAFPSYSHIFYSNTSVDKSELVNESALFEFKIEGMTCTGCEEHVKHEVLQLPGIAELEVSHESGNAVIAFNLSKVSADSISSAIEKTGYQVTSKTKLK